MPRILVVGGYGQVGCRVAATLVDEPGFSIVVAGRDLAKAAAAASKLGGNATGRLVDVTDAVSVADALADADVLVMCLVAPSTAVAEACLARGVHDIDISPASDVASLVERLRASQGTPASTAVFGVGLAPGLSSLLAADLVAKHGALSHVDLSLLLGVGEQHGPDGVRWLLDGIRDGDAGEPALSCRRVTKFPAPSGRRRAYTFGLADQHIVTETLPVDSATSWLAYDVGVVAPLLAGLRRIGLPRLLCSRVGYRVATSIFGSSLSLTRRFKVGTDRWALRVDATTTEGHQVSTAASGQDNSSPTAAIAARAAMRLADSNQSRGAVFLEELLDLSDVSDLVR